MMGCDVRCECKQLWKVESGAVKLGRDVLISAFTSEKHEAGRGESVRRKERKGDQVGGN